MAADFDVVVVGLGAMGSAAVYQLAKRGVRVLGIDRFAPPHRFGSSHGDTRLTRLATGEGPDYVPLVRRSHELWREIEAGTGMNLVTVTGGLYLAVDHGRIRHHGSENFVEHTAELATRFGVDHEVLDADDIRARFPQFALTGTERGYYESGAGFLRLENCISAQLRLATRHGAQLHTGERVLSWDASNSGVRVQTDAGTYTADQLVLAAGPWITTLLEDRYAQLFTVYRQVLYWFAAQGPITEFEPGRFPVFIWLFEQSPEQMMYGFPAIDGSDGGVKVASERYDITPDLDVLDRHVGQGEIEGMYRDCVAERLPQLSDLCVKAAACLYTVTPDFRFVIDRHPDHPNVLIASPCSGHGFKHSAAIGELITDLATNSHTHIDVEGFRLARFTQ